MRLILGGRGAAVMAVAALGMLGVGCAQDFDGLFHDGGTSGAAGDAGADGQVAPGQCDAGCVKTCNSAGDTCSFACPPGCPCTCPSFGCPSSGDCAPSCQPGTSCAVSCDTDNGDCDLGCSGCTGAFTCGDHADKCATTCTNQASCNTTCMKSPCTMKCTGGSQCILRCPDGADTCDMTCDGTKRSCPNQVITCNLACPN